LIVPTSAGTCPVILSPDEIAHFLEAAPGINHKAALSVGDGAGLRVSEIAFLKVTDIDSQRMMPRIQATLQSIAPSGHRKNFPLICRAGGAHTCSKPFQGCSRSMARL
jgi:integrase